MLLLIDNYDSFTWNLVHYLGEAMTERRLERETDAARMDDDVETRRAALAARAAEEIIVKRNDEISAAEALALAPDAIVLSPGPCDPDRAGVCLDLIAAASPDIPILGVCLGHQAIGQAFGGRVVRADEIVHGKTSPVRHFGAGVFRDLPEPMTATRYHSLTVAREGLPECLEITAETEDGVIMGLRHRAAPTYGVQYHPESIASAHGRRLLENFLTLSEII